MWKVWNLPQLLQIIELQDTHTHTDTHAEAAHPCWSSKFREPLGFSSWPTTWLLQRLQLSLQPLCDVSGEPGASDGWADPACPLVWDQPTGLKVPSSGADVLLTCVSPPGVPRRTRKQLRATFDSGGTQKEPKLLCQKQKPERWYRAHLWVRCMFEISV